MRAVLPWSLFAASLVLNLVFLSGAMVGGARELAKQQAVDGPAAGLADRLDLSAAQRDALEDLRAQARQRGDEVRSATAELRQSLLAEMAAERFDREAFKETLSEASEQRRAMFVDVAEMLHGYFQKLSPEQRADVLEMAQDQGFLKALIFGSGAPSGSPGNQNGSN
jgi:Spy/CpxP family protein refolding chaperone